MKFQLFKRTTVLLILIMTMQFVLRIPFLEEPLERDEGTYGYVAQRILEGEIPYRDIFDHKPPVVYYLYALVVKLFGNSILSLRTFTAFYSLLTTLGIFGLGYFLFGRNGGLLSAFLYALFSGGPFIQGTSSNTETFMVLPLVLALLMFYQWMVKRDLWLMFGSGFFSGLAVMIKQVAIFNFLALLGFLLFEPKTLNPKPEDKSQPLTPKFKPSEELGFRILNPTWILRSEVWVLILGFLVFPIFFTLYFWSKSAFADFFYCNFIVNYHYLRASPAPWFFFDPRFGLSRIWQQMVTENGIIWIFSLITLIIIFTKDRNKNLVLLALWTIFSFLGVCTGSLFFGHYFIQIIPSLCLLSSYALIKIIGSRKATLVFLAVILLVVLLIFILPHQIPFYTKFNPYQISEVKNETKTFGVAYALAQELSKILKPQDEIFVWAAEPEIYFYLQKKAPSKYPYYLIWMTGIVHPDQTLPTKLPRFIILGDYRPLFINLVRIIKDYYNLNNLKEKFFGWSLYERK